MTLQTALQQAQTLLAEAKIPAPRLTAEVLLAHAIGCNRSWLYAHSDEELKELWWIHYGRYLHQRLQHVPTQQITGIQEFFGRDFVVNRDVLIPRPETELVIETALSLHGKSLRNILDIGTGSGAIAVTLALETGASVVAIDISRPALAVAEQNAKRLGARISYLQCDLGSAVRDHSFELIVSNPPYVAESGRSTLQPEVRDHEPPLALFAGPDGLAIYRRLIPEAKRILKPDGRLILELGHDSLEPVRAMLHHWRDVQIVHDLANIPRVITAVSAAQLSSD